MLPWDFSFSVAHPDVGVQQKVPVSAAIFDYGGSCRVAASFNNSLKPTAARAPSPVSTPSRRGGGLVLALGATMQVFGICHFNLRAPRELLDSLRDFYCDVVGLSVGDRPAFSSFGYWLYAGPKDVLHLTESRPDEQRVPTAPPTFDHVAFSCVDSAAYESRLAAAGVKYSVDSAPGSGQLQLFFNDPAGNGVELNFVPSGA